MKMRLENKISSWKNKECGTVKEWDLHFGLHMNSM
jgi:hypothetical protein